MKRARRYQLIAGLTVLGLALLFLISVASHSPNDPPNPSHPANMEIANLAGVVGAYLSRGGITLIGTGCYAVVALMIIFGGMMVAGRQTEMPLWRAAGIVILLLSWCGGAEKISASGGITGTLMGKFILEPMGDFSWVLIGLGMIIGALMSAEVFVLWVGRKSVEMVTMHGMKPPAAAAGTSAPRSNGRPDRLAEQREGLQQRLEARKADGTEKVEETPPEPDKPTKAKTKTILFSELPTLIRKPPREPAAKKKAMHVDEPSRNYALPTSALLDPLPPKDAARGEEYVEMKREVLERTLEEFGIAAQVVEIDRGPVITQFELEIAPGIKITRIAALSDDIARALKAPSVRVVAPIPGKSTVGIEVPNTHREIVHFRELLDSGVLERKRMNLPLLMGKDASGSALVADLAQMPHMLIAGATGAGKSVCINSIIMSFLMTQYPEDVKLILIDPKMVELAAFRDIPHLMTPVVTDMKKAAAVLDWACGKMDKRYSLLANVGARNIAAYNALCEEGIRKRLDAAPDDDLEDIPFHMPYIVIIIDELADLMMVGAKEVENTITRLAQKSRAVGIHLIVATQRPSVDVVTGLIKANLPSRLAFQASSKVDSRTILDRNGAEKLLGSGDMLFLPPATSALIRAQGAFVTDSGIRGVTAYLQEQSRPHFEQELMRPAGSVDDLSPEERDDLFEEAARIILETQRGSVSLLQRKLGIGYSRAARLVDMMAEVGLVGDYKGSQAREVLFTLEEWENARGGEEEEA